MGLFGGSISLSVPLLPMRNLKLTGSYVGSLEEFIELLALLGREQVRTVPLIARHMSQINEIFEDTSHGRVAGRVVALA